MLDSLEAVIEPNHIGVVALLQDGDLLHHSPLLLLLIAENLLLDGLDGHEVLAHLVTSEVDLAECSSAQNPSDSVEVASAGLQFLELLVVQSDHLLQLFDIFVIFSQLNMLGALTPIVGGGVHLLVQLNHQSLTDVKGRIFNLGQRVC
jgi:hypothetical protein